VNERYLYSSEAELPADEEGQLPLFILDGRIKGEGPCSIPNCGKPVTSRLLCNMHYMRLLRHGSPHHLEPKGRRRKINDGLVWCPTAQPGHTPRGSAKSTTQGCGRTVTPRWSSVEAA